MPNDPAQRLAALLAQLLPVQEHASAAADGAAAAAQGNDTSEAVTVGLNGAGRVSAVEVRAGWRRLMLLQDLGAAVARASRETAC